MFQEILNVLLVQVKLNSKVKLNIQLLGLL